MGKVMIAIIDMQNGFLNENTAGIGDGILRFLEQVRDAEPLVVGTRYVNHPKTACYVLEGWKECMAGSREAEVLSALRPVMDRVFDKDKYSCWNDEMKDYVRREGIGKIYFVGVNTGCCVLHSVFDCYNDVVDCAVIGDLCGSTSGRKEHEAALVVLRSCITPERVITAGQAVKEIHSAMP